MRKQMKIAAVVSAAALLALGASITSFAASKGTWKYEDGEWYCYDKNGDVYENTFCLSNGKEFYVGDNGQMVTSSWVEDDGDYYFVNSAGQKIVNDWRLATPYDDDSADEQWFYFQSSGKRAENKKLLIKGKTYFFNGDGEMLTGWVQGSDNNWDEASTDDLSTNSNTYYCDETGARLEKAWVYDYAPGVDEDDNSDEDEHWYYLKSSGKAATGKQSNIKGQTYFFDSNGQMLTGWVSKTGSNGYMQVWEDDDDTDGIYPESLSEIGSDVYFCAEDGHMRKNKWIKEYNNVQYGEDDDDNDKFWFYLEKSGKVYIPSAADAVGTRYKLEDGEGDSFATRFSNSLYSGDTAGNVAVTEKKLNSKTYFFNQDGEMMSKFFKADTVYNTDKVKAGAVYYFGAWDDGVRKDGSVSITDESGESYRFYFSTENATAKKYYNAAGITGAKNGKLYEDGILVKANDYKYEEYTVDIDGNDYTFIINKSGSIQTTAKEYTEDDDTVVDARTYTFRKGSAFGALQGSIE